MLSRIDLYVDTRRWSVQQAHLHGRSELHAVGNRRCKRGTLQSDPELLP